MHIATAEALIKSKTLDELFPSFAERYIASFRDMGGRAPGATTGGAIWSLEKGFQETQSVHKLGTKWNEIKFNRSGGGCGASMRSAVSIT